MTEKIEDQVEEALRTRERFLADAYDIISTPERVRFIRRLRVDEDYTWRAVAEACHAAWRGDWEPPANQLMGMALCQVAAEALRENFLEDPWN